MRYQVDLAALAAIVGEDNVSSRLPDLEAHSIDESCVEPSLPDAIVWPANTDEVSRVLRYAYDNDIPVVPWSGGSSLEGNPVPVMGGIILAMYRLKEILYVNEDDLQVTVQPGIVYDALNAHLRRLGLFFPPAPGSADVATLGGMVSNNSSGMHAVKYGVTRNYVMKLKVVLPDGRIMDIGSRAKKSTSGYDLVGLFIGSEGTLGVITEITLRLMGLPEQVSSAVAVFETLGDATAAVYDAVRYGLDVAAIELLDGGTVRVTNEQQNLTLRETPTLFVEFHGPKAGVEDQAAYMREICQDNHCASYELADTPEQRAVLWAARREARNSIKLSHAGEILISG
ncbi:MAG: FAD-binding oxidoreductase, partial [Anaerolineae bacterium]